MSAAWAYQILEGEREEFTERKLEARIGTYHKTCRLILKALEIGLAGATVLRGPMGFGANSRLHTAKILRLSMDLPIVIEIIDTEEKINLLLPHLDEMVLEGLVTLEDVQILKYRAKIENGGG
jgi:PII-like signaling protein